MIFGIRNRPQSELLADIGTALLQVKNQRGLTLNDLAYSLGKGDDMVAKYIAGEAEMGVLAWLRANEAFPELAERIAETAADRAARSAQRPLDLDLPTMPGVAAGAGAGAGLARARRKDRAA
jgi:cyanate lyase